MLKILLSLILSMAFCVPYCGMESVDVAAVVECDVGTKLGFELLRTLNDGKNNQVISPVSLACALAMAAEGAQGETRQQILDALEAEDSLELTLLQAHLESAGLRQANAAFLTGSMTPKAEYVDALKELYGAKWFEPEKTSAESINRWVEDMTDGLIDRMLEEELSEDTALVLVNALAMDMKWQLPFDSDDTDDDVFHAVDGTVTVPFMHKLIWSGEYGESDGVQFLRLRYRSDDYVPEELTMLIALPGENSSVEAVLDGLCEQGLEYFTIDESRKPVRLSMPKVDLSVKSDLGEVLQALGIEAAFGSSADFSGITEDVPLRIGSVLQRVRLTMDEEGTRAAAASEVALEVMGMADPPIPVDFVMDRPFVLTIANEEAGAVCFAAIVTNPSAN